MGNFITTNLASITSLLAVSRGGVVLLVAVLVSIASIWFFVVWRRNGGRIEPLSQEEIEKHLSRKNNKDIKKNAAKTEQSGSKNDDVIVLRKHRGEKDE